MNSLLGTFVGAWLHPWKSMEGVKEQGEGASIVPSMIFVLVMGVLSGLITAIIGIIAPSTAAPGATRGMILATGLIIPVVSFLGSFIGAGIIWGLVDGILKGNADEYKTSYRLLAILAAFSPVSSLISPIPGRIVGDFTVGQLLAIGVNIWATIVMIKGIIIVRETPPVKTWVTCGILFAFLFTLGIVARVAAQRQAALNGPNFGDLGGDFGAPADDLGETSDNLEKQLNDLADKARTDQKAAPEEPKK